MENCVYMAGGRVQSAAPSGRAWRGWWLVAGGIVAGALYLFDPTTTGWWPRCWFRELTGWQCAGCGLSRALHCAVRGDWTAAWQLNPLWWLAIPWAVAMWRASAEQRRWLSALALAGAVAFMILRNIGSA